jgi:PTS system cellobiose-specific IIB component
VFGIRDGTDGKRRDGSMEILVICGAGASSTFVALRLRRSAAARGLDVSARAGSVELLASDIAGADLVLVGPHLADRLEDIREAARAAADVPVALLPESAVTSTNGDLALQTALDAAGVGS